MPGFKFAQSKPQVTLKVYRSPLRDMSTKIHLGAHYPHKPGRKKRISTQNIKILCTGMDHCAMNPKKILHLMKTEGKKSRNLTIGIRQRNLSCGLG